MNFIALEVRHMKTIAKNRKRCKCNYTSVWFLPGKGSGIGRLYQVRNVYFNS